MAIYNEISSKRDGRYSYSDFAELINSHSSKCLSAVIYDQSALNGQMLNRFLVGNNGKKTTPKKYPLNAIAHFLTDKESEFKVCDLEALTIDATRYSTANILLESLSNKVIPFGMLNDLNGKTFFSTSHNCKILYEILFIESQYLNISEIDLNITTKFRNNIDEASNAYSGWAINTPEDNILIFVSHSCTKENYHILGIDFDSLAFEDDAALKEIKFFGSFAHSTPYEVMSNPEDLSGFDEEARSNILFFEEKC